GERGPQVVEPVVLERDDRPEPVVTAGQLDHDQHLVAMQALTVRCVNATSKCIRHRRVPCSESPASRSEHEAGLENFASRKLAEAAVCFLIPGSYFRLNSGEVRTTSQPWRSESAARSLCAVDALSTPSRCRSVAYAAGGGVATWSSSALTKLNRASISAGEIQPASHRRSGVETAP